MSYSNSILQGKGNTTSTSTKLYQPEFPLRYDKIHGPYSPVTNERLSYQIDFENLLLTNPGEWPMDPELGIGIRHYLFENEGSTELQGIRPKMQRQLTRYLPYILLHSVDWVFSEKDIDKNVATIVIKYKILDTEELQELTAAASADGSVNLVRVKEETLSDAQQKRITVVSDQVTI